MHIRGNYVTTIRITSVIGALFLLLLVAITLVISRYGEDISKAFPN